MNWSTLQALLGHGGHSTTVEVGGIGRFAVITTVVPSVTIAENCKVVVTTCYSNYCNCNS